jgi:diguanylate cyclase (GGDEF)-like protein
MPIPPPNPDDIEQRVQMARGRVFFGHATGNMVSILIGWVLLTVVLSTGGVSDGALLTWGGLLVVTALVVSLYDRKVAREGITKYNHLRQVRIRSALGIVVVAFYGAAGFLLPWDAPAMVPDTFLFIIMSAVVTIAVLSYAVMPKHYLLLDLVSLVPLTLAYVVRYVNTGSNYYLVLIVLSVIWQTLVLRKSLRVSHTVIHAITVNERLQREVEEHMRTREAIRRLAMHDYLTDLANRRQFEETAERALRVSERDTSRLGLLAIDLDDFKPVNDRYGHAMGDQLLIAVAGRLRQTLRASDFAARMGGDEFAAIIHNVSAGEDVLEVVGKVRDALCQTYLLESKEIHVGASIGWAVYPQDGDTLESMLAVADQRMYADKARRKQGRGGVPAAPTAAPAAPSGH